MNRKKFLSQIGTTFAAAALAPNLISCVQKQAQKIRGLKNWAGNYTYQADEVRYPQTIEELAKLLKSQTKSKALGTQHCFNDIADTPGMQLSTKNLNSIIELNQASSFIIVESGIKYGDLGKELHSKGWALHNLASLPHSSIGGSGATATHGSGVKNGNLATALQGFELLTPDGDLIWVDPETNADLFYAGGVSMGALGIMTKVKLAIQPTFEVSQRVFENLPMDALKENFDTIMSAGYSVSFFTHWLDKNINQVWVKSREDKLGKSLLIFMELLQRQQIYTRLKLIHRSIVLLKWVYQDLGTSDYPILKWILLPVMAMNCNPNSLLDEKMHMRPLWQ